MRHLSQNLSYDNAGNVTSLSTTQAAVPGASGSGGSETQNFCYDEQNRLVWAGNSGTQPGAGNGTCGSGTLASGLNGASYNNSYVYTHLGQLWQGPLVGGSTQEQYLYCNSSQPHELSGLYALGSTCSSKTGQGYSSSYDPFGNVTGRTFSGTTATLSYDNLNHFTEWNAGSTNQEWYLYDAAGNRVLRRFTNGSGTTMIVYAFGLEEHNYSGAGAHQNDTYYYSLGGRLLGALDSNGTTFYLTDTLGSILASFSNAAGGASVKGNQVFAPYGTGRYYKGNINTLKGFTGQYNDGSGLDYFNARYYDPVAGVFLSADSTQGNLQDMNPYAYVNGNPETKSDPTGHRPVPIGGEGDGGGYVPPPPPPTWFRAARELEAQLMGAQYKKQPPPSDSSIAYDLGLSVEGDRHDNKWFPPPGKTGGLKAGTNGAAGEWYITDPEGKLIEYGSMLIGDSFISYSLGGPNRHAERLLLVNMLTSGATTTSLFVKMLEAGGGGLHFVVFTQLAPCGKCQAYFSEFLSGMKQQLEDFTNQVDIFGAELGAADNDENQYTVSLSVWATAYQDVYYTGAPRTQTTLMLMQLGCSVLLTTSIRPHRLLKIEHTIGVFYDWL